MPTYDYKCKSCGHTWELFQSMSAKHVKACPKCGNKTAERLIGTGAALLFKGSGFYETDYRSEGYKKSAEADKKGVSDAATSTTSTPPSTSSGTSDAKPAEAKPVTASDAGSKSKKETASAPAKSKKKGDKGG